MKLPNIRNVSSGMLYIWACFLISCLTATSTPSVSLSPKAQSASTSNATCPYRTVNYITHGLPQQCLNASWRNVKPTKTVDLAAENTTQTHQARTKAGDATETTVAEGYHTVLHESNAEISIKQDSSTRTSTVAIETPLPETHESPDADISNTLEETSPLDDGKFLSFEEWKRQNLKKIGQSEHIGKQTSTEQRESRKRSANIHAALDSLGDEGEIDLDFSGLIPDGPDLADPGQSSQLSQSNKDRPSVDITSSPKAGRRKDAGTTCKERFNYASFDCAANVLKTNKEARSASAVLGENKDSYMLNECSAQNKFLILELCDDISIDTIVLANFEFFSSIFRTFRVSVSDKYPVKTDKWKTLGVFEARNTRDVQAFLVENPVIWARYLRIEFLTHYGKEFYCPVSLVRVHGTTMMEDYKHDLEALQAEDEDGSESPEESAIATEDFVPEAVAEPVADDKEELRRRQESKLDTIADEPTASIRSAEISDTAPPTHSQVSSTYEQHFLPATSVSFDSSSIDLASLQFSSRETCAVKDSPSDPSTAYSTSLDSVISSSEHPGATATSSSSSQSKVAFSSETFEHMLSDITTLTSSKQTPQASAVQVDTHSASSSSVKSKTHGNVTQPDRSKSGTVSSQAHAAVPTMQESFFKSVQKRLQMLETNSSLSLQYIEDQSRAFRDAFNKVEQRQLSKTTTFLNYLNTTVLNELRDFRQQYDQLWQSTVIELQVQRERYQQENLAINARLAVLADELVFHKRMAMLQMLLILICLVLVLFTKGALNTYLEMPLVQSVLARSPSTKWMNLANLDTPSRDPPLTRARSAQQLRTPHSILKGHKRTPSGDSIDEVHRAHDIYTPPTPVSTGDMTDDEHMRDDNKSDDPSFDPSAIERPSTSPPILPSAEIPSLDANGFLDGDTIDSRLMNSMSQAMDDFQTPDIVIRGASPTPKHLTWDLPND